MSQSGEAQTPNTESPRVVIVVPTFNEADNLPVLYDQLTRLGIDQLGFIVIDDNSADGTGQVADRLAAQHDGFFHVIHRSHKQGLGTAYVAGFKVALKSGAEIIVEMDADLSHPTDEVVEMVRKLEGHDVVVGSRYMQGGGVDPSWNPGRRLLSWLGNIGIRTFVGVRITDATSGFKVFRSSGLARIDLDSLRSSGYAFQAEMSLACERMGLKVAEHPYKFHTRRSGDSKMSAGIVYEAMVRLLPLRFKH